jgi:hypothetical protein
MCEQFEEKMNGEAFSHSVRNHFPEAFVASSNPKGKLMLHGCPVQNSNKEKVEFDDRFFGYHPIRPDINSIENVFNIVRTQLRTDASENGNST